MEEFHCEELNGAGQLICAINAEDIAKITFLIKNGASVNERSPDVLLHINSPLQVVINNCNLEIV